MKTKQDIITNYSEKDVIKDMTDTIGQGVQEGIVQGVDIESGVSGVYEIAPGMTAEEMKAMFFADALIEPSYKVWQLNSKGHRYYYRFNDDGTPEFYPSVTTILSQTMPKSEFLIKWIADKGIEEAERYKMERAAYGTFMHAQFEELIINRCYDLDELPSKLLSYIAKNNLAPDFVQYADELKKDVLAFAQFVIDYDVKPLAVEIALVHPVHHYAGMIDLPCTMNDPKTGERINAIVDFKSGRKGFHEEHEIQLHLYAMMWCANYPDIPISKVFNFSPKDWRKKPTYNLKDQTDSPNAQKIPYLLKIAAVEEEKRNNTFTHVSGSINLDSSTDLSKNVISMTLSDIVKKRGNNNASTPSEEHSDDNIGEGVQEEVHEAVHEAAQEEVKQEPEATKAEEKQVDRLLNSTLEI